MRPNPMVITSIEVLLVLVIWELEQRRQGILRCSGYALPPKERCKQTINLIPEDELLNILKEMMRKLMHYVPVVVVRNAVRQWTVILLILIVNYMFVVIILHVMVMKLKKVNSLKRL